MTVSVAPERRVEWEESFPTGSTTAITERITGEWPFTVGRHQVYGGLGSVQTVFGAHGLSTASPILESVDTVPIFWPPVKLSTWGSSTVIVSAQVPSWASVQEPGPSEYIVTTIFGSREALVDSPSDTPQSVVLDELKAELRQVFIEACSDNWDGYGATPVSQETYRNALTFLEVLLTTVPPPDIAADPDGEISFEWHLTPQLVFSISVGPSKTLNYAGLFKGNRTYGVESFTEGLPAAVAFNLERLLSGWTSQA